MGQSLQYTTKGQTLLYTQSDRRVRSHSNVFLQLIFFQFIINFMTFNQRSSTSWDGWDDEDVKEEYYDLRISFILDTHWINSDQKFESFINQIIEVKIINSSFDQIF